MWSHQQVQDQARVLASRMRSTLDSTQTAQEQLLSLQLRTLPLISSMKDFASYERDRRQEEKRRRQSELERKRIQILERENKRWEMVQQYQNKLKEREDYTVTNQRLGIKRTANSNGLAYNPITLEYDRNPEGDKLRRLDEDSKIRGYVRAHNMDYRGNSKFNPLTGQSRPGIEQVIPGELNHRFEQKKNQHYENMRLKVPPSSANDGRPNSYSRFY